MTLHRYLSPFWWSLRLSRAAAIFLPDPWVMECIGRASRFGGEAELTRLLSLVDPDRLAIDIGAAEGVYAWHLKRLAHKCIAFEPNPVMAKLVRRRLPCVELHECALSSRAYTARLRIPVGNVPLTGLGTIETANDLAEFAVVKNIDVQSRTLDSFHFRSVGFMKIDVEGHEIDVLRGARETLVRDRPVLLIEIEERHRPNALSSVARYLSAVGYGAPERMTSPQNFVFRPID